MKQSTRTSHDSGEGHLAFMRRVTQDDRFRAALEADPRAALAEYGLNVDSKQIPSKVTVPTEESIQGVMSSIEDETADKILEPKWVGFIGWK